MTICSTLNPGFGDGRLVDTGLPVVALPSKPLQTEIR